MCLIGLAIGQHPRFPLVIAANRDEFHARPAAPLDWWTPPGGSAPILAGRDLEAGGTWMGLASSGRIAMLTNVREPDRRDAGARSRGEIVTAWLTASESMQAFWPAHRAAPYNGFNLLAADARGDWFCASNRDGPPRRLAPGLYGLSNALLDAPWPKVRALKHCMRHAIEAATSADEVVQALLEALGDPHQAPEDELPQTGVEPAWERLLSAAFVHSPERGYGTRCSTVVITEQRDPGSAITHVFERSYTAAGAVNGLRHVALAAWPPAGGASGAVAHAPDGQPASVRTISMCGTPASSNTGPRSLKPARA